MSQEALSQTVDTQSEGPATAAPNGAATTPPAAAPAGATPAAPTPASPGADLAELQAKAAKADEHWDRYVRIVADFDNFKKRAARERQDAIRFANESLLSRLLPVLDNFEAALAAAAHGPANPAESLKAGVAMIGSQLRNVLVEAGLEEVDALGKPFDPNWHEAVSQMDSTEVPEGQVLQQLRKGYKLRDRLLRPATVIVARPPAA